jgi:hypothetical protein
MLGTFLFSYFSKKFLPLQKENLSMARKNGKPSSYSNEMFGLVNLPASLGTLQKLVNFYT